MDKKSLKVVIGIVLAVVLLMVVSSLTQPTQEERLQRVSMMKTELSRGYR